MHYCWHCNIRGSDLSDLYSRLSEYQGASISIFYTLDGERIWSMVVDIKETHADFPKVMELITTEPDKHLDVLHFPEYTEKELTSALWMAVRSSFSKVIPENATSILIRDCALPLEYSDRPRWQHRSECGGYVVKKPIKWGKHGFASSITGEDYLFCSDLARNILENNGIKGIEFYTVLKQSSGKPMENLHQMTAFHKMRDSGIVGIRHTKDYFCPVCGMKMLISTDDRYQYAVKEDAIPSDVDFCRTLPLFLGQQRTSLCDATGRTLISQKMYRAIKENHLERSLWFTPIEVL